MKVSRGLSKQDIINLIRNGYNESYDLYTEYSGNDSLREQFHFGSVIAYKLLLDEIEKEGKDELDTI